jgi:hypothetical protein
VNEPDLDLTTALADLARRVAQARVESVPHPESGRTMQWRTFNGQPAPWEEPIAELLWIQECRKALTVLERTAVRRIRGDGAGKKGYWEEVGQAFGITKQAAHKRWSTIPAPPGGQVQERLAAAADELVGGMDDYLASQSRYPGPAARGVRPQLKPPRRSSPPRRPRSPEAAAQYDQVRELRVDGNSAKKIAALTGLTMSTVYRYLAVPDEAGPPTADLAASRRPR